MDMFVVSMAVGSLGLLSMAAGGLRHQGRGHHGHTQAGRVAGRASHTASHATHTGRAGHAGTHGRAGTTAHTNAATHAHAAHAHGNASPVQAALLHGATWLLGTPRILFSLLLGFGATGLALDSVLSEWPLIGAALAGGVFFERIIITPIWNFAMRFASRPALTLESVLMDEATAVTSFNRDGEGIIAIELDGQVVQVLARLRSDDRAFGAGVRVGQRVRIEEVNAANNRCTVSVL